MPAPYLISLRPAPCAPGALEGKAIVLLHWLMLSEVVTPKMGFVIGNLGGN